MDIFSFHRMDDLRNTAVNEHWKTGTHTFLHCYEMLVSSACVEKVLIEDNLRDVVKEEITYFNIQTSLVRSVWRM